jgi:RnfABCDGE-type electron transport complex B subunit
MLILGGFLGLALAIASRRFAVTVDPRVEQVIQVLPGANCGGCGFAGCSDYAGVVVEGKADIGLCGPGGAATAAAIARILNREGGGTRIKEIARCTCQRQNVATVAIYNGVRTCRGAALVGLGGGWLDCRYGCLGYGDCLKSCPFGAIRMDAGGRPEVDPALCVGCRKCATACPRGLMTVGPVDRPILVLCRNRDKGAVANKTCAHSCIACRRCEKACPREAIKITNNLAEIDYGKCAGCGACVEVCPHHVIYRAAGGSAC